MAEQAAVLDKVQPPAAAKPDIRRFELPDLDRVAPWFFPRFLKKFPHLNERAAVGFLKGVLYQNDFKFLFWDHAVGCAQTMNDHQLAGGQPVIWERFTFVEDPANAKWQEAASYFYKEWEQWAKWQGVSIIRLSDSDVPNEVIQKRVGRVYDVKEQFFRV